MSASLLLAGDPRSIWKRYVIALLLIAGLLTTSHLAPKWSIEANAKNAELINTSGRQRMLSQRVLVLSAQLAEEFDQEIADELSDTIQVFSDTQTRLATHASVKSQLSDLYGAPGYLTDRVRAFSLMALDVADSKADTQAAYRKLRAFDSTALLSDLDLAVAEIEIMAGNNIERLKGIQSWSLYAAILILVLEALLIFLPAQLSVTRFIKKLEENSEALVEANNEVNEQNRSLQDMQQRLETDRQKDHLTGIANRLGIHLKLKEIVSDEAATDLQLSVFHIDLNGFRVINDAYGQKGGDLVLKHIARLLSACAPDPDLVARIGSDEFLVALRSPASNDELHALASSLKQVVEKPIDIGMAKCHIGANIGIASTSLIKCGPQQLLRLANVALNRAKAHASGGAVLFEMDLLDELRAQKNVAQELDLAFAEDQFAVHYQPIYCSDTRRISSLEALVRWDHPVRGIQSAGQFMDHIYRLGLSSKLDQFVLSRVIEDVENAKANGIAMPKVAINVSAASLMDTDYLERVSGCELPESGLALEISESVDFESHIEFVTDRVAEFAAMGFDIEIDDFGTGHASLYSFKKLRPSRIKIARELVLDVQAAEETRQMVQTICTLAKSFGARTVAEGVEDEEMATALTTLGCDFLQGFGLSRPQSYEDTLQLLQPTDAATNEKLDAAA